MIQEGNNEDRINVKSEDFESPLPEIGILQNHPSLESNFSNQAVPTKKKPDISRIRELIAENDSGVARYVLEDWVQNNPDDSESIALLLETIDPSDEPFLHSHYSSILLSLDKSSTIYLANLFSNSYSQLKSSNSYSIKGLTAEFSKIMGKSPGFLPEEISRAAILSGKSSINIHPLASNDINLSLLRHLGEEEPSLAVEFSYHLGPERFDERGLKSAVIYCKRARNLLFALLLLEHIDNSIWNSDQRSEIYVKLLNELSTDDPAQVDNALKFASIPKRSLRKLALDIGEDRSSLYRQLFIQFKDADGPLKGLALEAGVFHQRNSSDVRFLDVLSNRLGRSKFSESALDATEKAVIIDPTEDRIERFIKLLSTIDSSNSGSTRDAIRQRFEKIMDEIGQDWKPHLEFMMHRNDGSPDAINFTSDQLSTETKFFVKLLARSTFNEGEIDSAISILESARDESDSRTLKFWSSLSSLYHNGLKWPKSRIDSKPERKSCFYLLHNSAPFHSGGYATRSHGLMRGLNSTKWNPIVISRLGYPNDLKNWVEEVDDSHQVVDGINYFRMFTDDQGYGQIPMNDYLSAYCKSLESFIDEYGAPEIIHAASNFMNGYAAVYCAKKLGLKSVYEVRGLWEVTRASRQPSWSDSQHYRLLANLEAEVAINADHVFCITRALANEMISRGVDADKITILPNGVNPENFVPLQRDEELSQTLGLDNKTVIGYVGSTVMYEGLEDLVEAFSLLPKRIRNNSAMLFVGDGDSLPSIKKKCDDFGIKEDEVVFTGRVPHEEVNSLYSLIDIAPIPRSSLPVTEMVSPMKPFEAMSMEKLVLVSSVDALDEIVDDGKNGRIFLKDDVEDLSRVLLDCIKDKKSRNSIGQFSRAWVIENRSWSQISQKIPEIYMRLTE